MCKAFSIGQRCTVEAINLIENNSFYHLEHVILTEVKSLRILLMLEEEKKEDEQ